MSEAQSTLPGDVCVYLGELFATAQDGCRALDLPTLRRIAARADWLSVPVSDSVSFVCWAAGLDEQSLPIAAICRYADTGETDGQCWLRAELVQMQPAQDSLRLLPAHPLEGGAPEAALVDAVSAHLAQDGWGMQVAGARDWYLRAPRPLKCVTTPPERVAGRDVFEFMPQGEDGRQLRSLINDVQMLMHNHGNGGAMSVNSIWPWGQGVWDQVPPTPGRAMIRAFSNHPLVRGLWRHWNSRCRTPGTADTALESADGCVIMPDLGGGEEGLERLERDWLAPLVGGLSDGRAKTLSLVLANGLALRLTRGGLRRFWRRPPTVEAAVTALQDGPLV